MTSINVTIEQLFDLFRNNSNELIGGATFGSITTITQPRLNGGKSNPFNGLQKYSTANVMFFQNATAYANAVRKRLEKNDIPQEKFELKPRKWGTRVKNTPIIEHTNAKGIYNEYLNALFLTNNTADTVYLLNGKVIDSATAKEQIYVAPSKGGQGGLQGTKDEVITRDFASQNIISVTVNKTKYIVK